MMRVAKSSDWHTKPLSAQHIMFQLDKTFSPEQMQLVRAGVLPREMEERWFIYCENDTVYFHRSWTGACIYIMHLIEHDGIYAVESVKVSHDPEQYTNIDLNKEKELLIRLIDKILLRPRHE